MPATCPQCGGTRIQNIVDQRWEKSPLLDEASAPVMYFAECCYDCYHRGDVVLMGDWLRRGPEEAFVAGWGC